MAPHYLRIILVVLVSIAAGSTTNGFGEDSGLVALPFSILSPTEWTHRPMLTTFDDIKPLPTWQCQFTLQGQFKEPIRMDELYMGEAYDRPLVGMPHPIVMKAVRKVFAFLVPGIQLDVDHPKHPRVLALFGGTVTALRVDEPGKEPNIAQVSRSDMTESSLLLSDKFATANARKSILSRPRTASSLEFDTTHVYTFQHQDTVMNYMSYHANLAPGLRVDLIPHLDGQAMSLGAITNDGRWMFRFRIWNERTLLEWSKNDRRCE
ncbi:hypothetical protein IV203_011575 [Nitzschia inconspicua]|uniref:Domain of unknown function at the cortex 1 domain-containing protein n=1 Tax=Nitzschia inconspicua TaxID=303405 RepID=A0A9K3KTW8_9STRA|nr:hypothetical protein IV203_011575 [Nitzschia inconspicua]